MVETETLVVGASLSGLAVAACLKKQGVDFTIIEQQSQVAPSWRKHYDRLHLHTNKRISHLPYKRFPANVPRYPSRQQVIDYVEDYCKGFNIHPYFNTAAKSIRRENGCWITKTSQGNFRSTNLVMATGSCSKARSVDFPGMEQFRGPILHSSEYKTGASFYGKKVLVVGFGNSACEIAIDLHEHGASPSIAIRSPVNVIPRDLCGIPILEISLLLRHLNPRVADRLTSPVLRLLYGKLDRFGLKQMPFGPFEQVRRNGMVPVLDIGIIDLIKDQKVAIFGEIDHLDGNTVHFTDGQAQAFDAIIAGIGYYRDCSDIIEVQKSRFEDLGLPLSQQRHFGEDGLYFCGFWISPTGQIREIARDAKLIARSVRHATKRSSGKPQNLLSSFDGIA